MAKTKGSKGKNIPNKHIHARLSYLHQASSYLSLARQNEIAGVKDRSSASPEEAATTANLGHCQARYLLSQLRAVSLKSQIRLSSQVKHSLCKRCNSLLLAGKTSTERIVNGSNGARKQQADVLAVQCNFCESSKRFPVGQSLRLTNWPSLITKVTI